MNEEVNWCRMRTTRIKTNIMYTIIQQTKTEIRLVDAHFKFK